MDRRAANLAVDHAYGPPRTGGAHVLARLKLAIQALGYSLRNIEQRLKISDGYLSRVCSGAIELNMEHVVNIAKALQMTPADAPPWP